MKTMAVVALISTAACDQSPTPASEPVEYRPGEAGTVDHAMCLLGFTAIPLREVSTGHHLVEAEINGTKGRFVLDTGANVSVINKAKAAQFALDQGVGGSGSVDRLGPGPRGAQKVSVDSFAIGPVTIRQDQVVTADLGQLLTSLGQISGEEVAGIIGQDVLTEHRAIIDVAKPLLYLMKEDQDPSPIPADRCARPRVS